MAKAKTKARPAEAESGILEPAQLPAGEAQPEAETLVEETATVGEAQPEAETPVEDTEAAQLKVNGWTTGRIEEIALAPIPPEVYLPRHVDVQMKTDTQRQAMKKIHRGLDNAGARTLDGRRVVSMADAVRWLLEHLMTD